MPVDHDAIIIGAGHNGLVCASYLARAGLKTTVVEQHESVGGACVTEPLFDGCKVSKAASWFGMFRPQIIQELNLYQHGFDPYPMDPQVVALYPDGRKLVFWLDSANTSEDLCHFAPEYAKTDVPGLARFDQYADRVLEVIRPLFLSPACNLEELATRFRVGGIAHCFEEVIQSSLAQLLDRFVRNPELQSAIAFSPIAITNGSPFDPRTAFQLFYMMAAETRGIPKAWGFVRGGMGALSQALAQAALLAGVEIRTRTEVSHILIEKGQAQGVVLTDGTVISGRFVVSNADPKHTYLRLVPSGCLAPDFIESVRRIEMSGRSSMVHFLLDALPQFRSSDDPRQPGPEHRGMIVIAPSMDYLDRASRDADQGRISHEPIITFSMQTVTDSTIAPKGKHLLSAFVQHTPYNLTDGLWNDNRWKLVHRVLDTLEIYLSNIHEIVLEMEVLTPPDIEADFGLTGGHPEHGDMGLHQLFDRRPVRGWADYRTPVQNLYLCGAGTHPGGTVTGAPGRNSALTILGDVQKRNSDTH